MAILQEHYKTKNLFCSQGWQGRVHLAFQNSIFAAPLLHFQFHLLTEVSQTLSCYCPDAKILLIATFMIS